MKFTKKQLFEELKMDEKLKKSFTRNKPQNIVVSETQLERLLEAFVEDEEPLETGDLDVMEDSSEDESYNYGKDMGHDDKELYDLKHHHASASHIDDLEDDIHYDHEKDWGINEECLEEQCVTEDLHETIKSIRRAIIREKITKLNLKDYKPVIVESLKKAINEAQDEWRGHNPGASAAAGIENIIDNIKRAYSYVKDSRTRKQISNTLTKLNNFMTYSAELIGSGRDQRQARSYDQVSSPLPYPDLDEPEALEDVDDELQINEEKNRIRKMHQKVFVESNQLNEIQGINAERIAKELHDAMKGLGTDEKKFFSVIQPTGRQGLTPDEQQAVQSAFKNLYDDELCSWIGRDFSGKDLEKALVAVGCKS